MTLAQSSAGKSLRGPVTESAVRVMIRAAEIEPLESLRLRLQIRCRLLN